MAARNAASNRSKITRAREEFEQNISTLEYTLRGSYVRSRDKVPMTCDKGHEIEMSPQSIREGHGCKKCADRWDECNKSFRDSIEEMCGTVMGEYVNAHTPVQCICWQGHECSPYPMSIQRGDGMCWKCGHRIEEARNAFLKRAEEQGVTVRGEYVDMTTPVLCTCKAGHDCSPRPNSVLRLRDGGAGFCPTCSGNNSILPRERMLKWLQDNNFQILGEYTSYIGHVPAICPKGHECSPSLRNIDEGVGVCPSCRPVSRGEDKLDEALRSLKIKFNREITLGSRLRLDFELPEDKIIFETDGPQHFVINLYVRTQAKLKVRQITDVIKMLDATLAGYTVVRIDYTWYSKPVEEFCKFVKEILDRPRESLPPYIYSTPSMYKWVDEILSR